MSLDNSLSTPYFEIHPGHGPYLLLVHGLLSCRAQWMLNISALSQVTRPVVVELLGHGRSPAPASPEAYRPEKYVEAFENIRKQLGVDEWFICGQSLGASLTLRYALDLPRRIKAHAFTNTTSSFREISYMDNAREDINELARQLLAMGTEGLKKIPVHPANARNLHPDVKAALIEGCMDISLQGVVNGICYTRPEASVRDRVNANTVPSLLVCGKREKRFLPFRDFAREHMACLEIVELDAGHAVNIDAAEEFNNSVSSFFLEHTRGHV
jgi:2-succinyl-6-hydroxy-2,4-cyclohexadiene-1-carboxylate synthase